MTTPNTNPVPQPRPQYDPYLAAATAVAFPGATALSLSAQAANEKVGDPDVLDATDEPDMAP